MLSHILQAGERERMHNELLAREKEKSHAAWGELKGDIAVGGQAVPEGQGAHKGPGGTPEGRQPRDRRWQGALPRDRQAVGATGHTRGSAVWKGPYAAYVWPR